ncbi:alcohol dehydrogenase catalytic domain-containing protein [Denitrobaculum tricleocarpae]|uniref:Zinc-binding dehydrogenase n=1 Tax=Denitrobaculum tricleocarpae TaxID=2591009 RepID=A0A545U334_9PROT|nr:alcohol dehydrogenase catalytic domain-containing protein [Denitrobaculum tricleocarpae]TQV83876.1 zinc-binding dehydrogenase [Denitrobaculum tricleocarpae]
MKALVYTAPETLIYRDETDPLAGDGECLVKIDAVGICGSDMHAFKGHDQRRPAPLILGHEASGVVIEGGTKGRRVVINPLVSCGQCSLCLSGRINLCPNRQIISMQPRQGAFAEMITIPERNLIDIPEGMDSAKAALAEPIATALHGVLLAAKASDRPLCEVKALVLGGGAVGLSAALVLCSHGCRQIQLGDTNPLRRQTAEAQDIGEVYDPISGPFPDENSIDVVIDAVGSGATRAAALAAVRPGGTVVHIGLQDSKEGIDIRKITLQEIAFIGSYTYSMVDFRATVAAMQSGALGKLDWIEQRPLSEGAMAFEDLSKGATAAAKIVLRPS